MPDRSQLDVAELEEALQKNMGKALTVIARDYQKSAFKGILQAGHPELQISHQAVFLHLGLVGARLTKLAERASLSKQSMGQIINELEELGYVERIPDPLDRRAKIVQFTKKGRSFIQSSVTVGQTVEKRYAKLMGEKKMQRLCGLLDELYGKLGAT